MTSTQKDEVVWKKSLKDQQKAHNFYSIRSFIDVIAQEQPLLVIKWKLISSNELEDMKEVVITAIKTAL